MPKKYPVLITGSSGMLGSDLARELAGKYEVIGTDAARRASGAAHRFYKAGITDRKQIAGVIGKAAPDIVVHTAAWTDVDGCELDSKKAYAVNAYGTENVALACRDLGAVLIYISTDFVFDGKKKGPYRENDRARPLSVYADSKFRGETLVKKALKDHFILRTSWLYGENGKNFVDTIIAKAKKDGCVRVVDDQVGSPTYTVDLAKAIHLLIDKMIEGLGVRGEGSGIYHVSNSGSVSWYEYAKTILRMKGIRAKVEPISSKELGRPAKRPAMSVMDCSKFRDLTGHRMRGWRDALKEYLS